jgi:hypothetical protein
VRAYLPCLISDTYFYKLIVTCKEEEKINILSYLDGAAAAQGGGGLPLLEGGQPAQLEALALP